MPRPLTRAAKRAVQAVDPVADRVRALVQDPSAQAAVRWFTSERRWIDDLQLQICRIPGSRPIPLGELPKRLAELNPNDEIVAHCKSGMRSGKAVDFLKQSGFTRARNMKGGILAWSDKVDPSVPKY